MQVKIFTGANSSVTLTKCRVTRFTTDSLFEGEAFNRSGRKHHMEGTGFYIPESGTTTSKISDILDMNTTRLKVQVAWTEGGGFTTLCDPLTDSRNGPFVQVTAAEIIGSNANSVVGVTFSATFFSCGDSRIQRFDLTVRQSIDRSGFITLTKEGVLTISQSLNTATTNPVVPQFSSVIPSIGNFTTGGNSPDLYRELVCGRPPALYTRTRQDYTTDPSLRNLTFSVEDRMVFRDLKDPVMQGDASFDYERSLTDLLGIKRFTASFEGGPDTPPSMLMAIAYEACQARIDFAKDLIQSIQIKEPSLYQRNKIELTVVARGTEDGVLQVGVIKQIFNALHLTGNTIYSSAYPNRSVVQSTMNGLIYDPCNQSSLTSIIQDATTIPEGGNVTVTVGNSNNNVVDDDVPDTKPQETDTGFIALGGVNISSESSTQKTTEDTGMIFLETCGGGFQYPFQIRLPTATFTQTVTIVSLSKAPSIPWDNMNEPFIVLHDNLLLLGTRIDAVGKKIYTYRAERTIRIQITASRNTTRIGSETGLSRVVYNPVALPSPRTQFSLSTSYSTMNTTSSTAANTKTDYLS